MEISMNVKRILALAAAAVFAAPLAAQTSTGAERKTAPQAKSETPAAGATKREGGFAAVDRNGDGYISRGEAKDMPWADRFSELDKDNDERISQSEFEALQSAAGATSRSPVK
jgi:hypothetical protein